MISVLPCNSCGKYFHFKDEDTEVQRGNLA